MRSSHVDIMTSRFPDEELHEQLAQRVGRVHLKQRLGIERDYEQRIFGQGRNFFHIENWYSIHSVIRNSLRLCLLHGRGRRNARKIVVRQNRIVLEELPAAFDGYVILQISDPHLDMASDFPHALIDTVRTVRYDLCVLTGDFRANTFGSHDAAMDGMRMLRTHLEGEVYGVLGNHDTILMVPALESMGIRMLLNEHVSIVRDNDALILAGIDDPHYYRADNLEKTADDIPSDMVSILLAHSPEIYRHAAYADFDVILCGHTHGGQICLPGGIPLMCNARCPRAVCSGAWIYNSLHGYTSAGSGASIVDVRLNCPPEITLHYLHRG
jgi:predicted MPP superfamily phosphohydrolase